LFGPIEPRYREYSKNVIDSGKHLLGLINDILDFSKIESGRFDLREASVDAAGTIADTVQMLHRHAEEAGIRLTVEVPARLPPLRADPQRLRQILLNLLANALKFTPRGGHVQVTAAAQETGLVIAIRDTGIGMADEDIPNALERFVQIDSDLNRKHGGTGLGLPLSKRLMELHGGMLEIESAIGVGTTVRLTFPRQRVLDAA
jgi:signal transduction histidine kinase